ncbi:MAG: molybdopterin-dependent oxidoreductase, partial [Desulfobacterales bacterium]|nr:molybdopterin-dependent oxidoreductase [Desulfobacterales bacterium]
GQDRHINTNKLAREILSAKDPAIQMMWVTLRNPFSQDFDRPLLEKAFSTIDLVVCVDQFFTQTTEQADIVLPVTTCFEEDSINVSYWHYWLGLNQKAIEPLHECKSNTQIAMALSKKMNDLYPGSCTFPTDMTPEQWINHEFNDEIYHMFGISSWKELKKGPIKAKIPREAWSDFQFATPSGKYEFFSELARSHGHKALPEYIPKRKSSGPLQVLTPHSKFAIHSQFQNIDYMEAFNPEPHVVIHPAAASVRKIKDGQWVRVFNRVGELVVKSRVSRNVPEDCVVLYEAWFNNQEYCVQNVVDDESSDMGALKAGAPGVALHDQYADIEPFNKRRIS